MFSVMFACLFTGGIHVTTTRDAIGQAQLTWDLPPGLFKLVHLGPPSDLFKLVFLAAGWSSTERPSCFACVFSLVTVLTWVVNFNHFQNRGI